MLSPHHVNLQSRNGARVEGGVEQCGAVDVEAFQTAAIAHVGDDEQAAAAGHVQLHQVGELGQPDGQFLQQVGADVEKLQRFQLPDVVRQVMQRVVRDGEVFQFLQFAQLVGQGLDVVVVQFQMFQVFESAYLGRQRLDVVMLEGDILQLGQFADDGRDVGEAVGTDH